MEDPTYQVFTSVNPYPNTDHTISYTLKKIYTGNTPFTDYDDAVRWIESKGHKDEEYLILSVYKR